MNIQWDQLARQRVCFGHQSVGANLIEGVAAVSDGRLTIVESRDPEMFQHPVFAHFRVGQNRDPFSKLQDFASAVDAGIGERADVALFKFCYVDITAKTDIHELFGAYRSVMDVLAQSYPAVVFLHVTVPLRRVGGGLLGWMCEKIGGFDQEREGQVKRHTYNELLRGAYGASGRMFDLAAEESAYPDGRASVIQYRHGIVPNLVAGYTDDGGHLNRPAAERIAGRLLACVSSAGAGGDVCGRQRVSR